MEENSDSFYKMNFAQREGKAPLPEPMRLEYVPIKFRQFLWICIDNRFRYIEEEGLLHHESNDFFNTVRSYFFEIHDEFQNLSESIGYEDHASLNTIVTDGNYHEVLTLVEFLIRNENCPLDLKNQLREIFDKCQIVYFIQDIIGLPTIVPRITKESGDATQRSIETVDRAGMAGASAHLRQAVEHINAGQFADSIADSIHAVESIVRTINPKAKKLGSALDSLQRSGLLKHPALKEAFSKLYGYTNDEQGIRHALLDKASPDVDLDEAMFMFGACASFAAYLVNKHRKAAQRQGSGQ